MYMLGRSKERTEAAATDVIRKTGVDPAMVQVMVVDLASLQSVRDFAAQFKTSNIVIHKLTVVKALEISNHSVTV